jgi:small conductance mechanosensitive channel
VRPWANNEDFWGVYADTLQNCKQAFDDAGIIIQPFVKESSKKNNPTEQLE